MHDTNCRFYYDFFFPEKKLSDSDLKQIKSEMDKIIKADLPIRREEVTREEARYVGLTTFTDTLLRFCECSMLKSHRFSSFLCDASIVLIAY